MVNFTLANLTKGLDEEFPSLTHIYLILENKDVANEWTQLEITHYCTINCIISFHPNKAVIHSGLLKTKVSFMPANIYVHTKKRDPNKSESHQIWNTFQAQSILQNIIQIYNRFSIINQFLKLFYPNLCLNLQIFNCQVFPPHKHPNSTIWKQIKCMQVFSQALI